MMGVEMRHYTWTDGKTLTLGERPLIMGILNVTADSFSDGGQWNTVAKAIAHMEEMIRDGADIIDIGAESSRPGFTPISAVEEINRLSRFLPDVLAHSTVPVSVDTFKAETAEYAMSLGAHIMNDIWGLQYAKEPGKMAKVAAKYNVPVIVMHNQDTTDYGDLLLDMKKFFHTSVEIAVKAGVDPSRIITDPGIGLFCKTTEQNIYIIKHLHEFTALPYPLLLGPSRKGFIGDVLDLPVTERLEGTGAVCVSGVLRGASIIRVHDVKPIKRMCIMAEVLKEK